MYGRARVARAGDRNPRVEANGFIARPPGEVQSYVGVLGKSRKCRWRFRVMWTC